MTAYDDMGTGLRSSRDSGPQLDQGTIDGLIPGQELYLPLSHCVRGLQYEDGSPYPDQEFHYTLNFRFETMADTKALTGHPEAEEIVNTIRAYMREEAASSFDLEIERDYDPFYEENGEAGPGTLTSGTLGDLDVVVSDMVSILNETYGLNIKGASVSTSVDQINGCGPSPWILPENIAGLSENSLSHITASVALPPLKP